MTMTTKQKTLTTFILSAIFLTSVGVYQQALADSPHLTSLVAKFVTTPGVDPDEHPYTDVSRSQPVTEMWVFDDSLDGGYFDAVEPAFQEFGLPSEPIPDFSKTYHSGGVPVLPPINFVKGYEEAHFIFDGLEADKHYTVTVTIDNLADFTTAFGGLLWEDDLSSIPILETIFVTGNGKELGSVTAEFGGDTGTGPTDQTITKTLEVLAKSNGAGELIVGFNEYFQWDPSVSGAFDGGEAVCTPAKLSPAHPTNPNCKGTQSGMRVAEISLLPGYLTADKAEIETKTDKNEVKLKFHALDTIPTAGFFGYGILPAFPTTPTGTLLIATTHAGVLDSQDQVTKDDPVWHTHYVDLVSDPGTCPDGLSVDASRLTFTSPGEVKLKDKKLEIKKAPLTDYRDVNFFGGTLQHYSLGDLDHIGTVVSFTLSVPSWTDMPAGIPAAVCVNDIQAFDAKLKEKP